jgi:subtilisin-like proprotein convertase family protein
MTATTTSLATSRTHRRLGRWAMIASLGLGAAFAVSSPATAAETAPTGPGMTIGPGVGGASVYPSTIEVSDVPGSILSARVTLTELTHTWTSDLNIVLQAPDGHTVLLLSGCRDRDDVNGTLTFADGGEPLELGRQNAVIGSGTYSPSKCAAPKLVSPAPACPCGHYFAPLVGGDPNGTWSLYVYDDAADDNGALTGWTLELTTNAPPVATDGSFTGPEASDLRDSLAALASDPDNDQLDFGLASEPAHGSVFLNRNGTFNYRPDDGYVGTDTFTYSVDDGRVADDGAVTITVTDVDGVGPLAHPAVSSAASAAGWHRGDVTVSWNWTDDATGVDPAHCTGSTTSQGQGILDLTGSCRDLAGNETTAHYTVKVDTTAPTATISSPTSQRYLQDSTVTAGYSCRDTVSGIDNCVGTVADGARLDTSTPGRHQFTVTAEDRAGNPQTTTVPYNVIVRPTCAGRPATIVGTAGSDRIAGTSGNDVIVTGGGVDLVNALAGDDTICSGATRDTVRGGSGDDTIIGQAGDDILVGGDGSDVLRGGTGFDNLLGLGGDDYLDGGRNDDGCRGGTGTDRAAACESVLGIP